MSRSPSYDIRHIFEYGEECSIEGSDRRMLRSSYVDLQCCLSPEDKRHDYYLKHVEEFASCQYRFTICVPTLCQESTSTDSSQQIPMLIERRKEQQRKKELEKKRKQEKSKKLQEEKEKEAEIKQEENENEGINNAKKSQMNQPPQYPTTTYYNTPTNYDETIEEEEHKKRYSQNLEAIQEQEEEEEEEENQNQFGSHKVRDGIVMNEMTIERNKQIIKNMFEHAYDGYITNAFPYGELNPLTCSGKMFDLIKIPAVTLIDTLDTLVILNNFTEFKKAIQLLKKALPNQFDIDMSVSVFESNIRLLGGLISAHQLAMDKDIGIFKKRKGDDDDDLDLDLLKDYNAEIDYYDGYLLDLAIDLGDRLLPAFNTPTNIPYGTVNLKYGVPRGETMISSLAGSGSLTLEFTMLSKLSKNNKYLNVSQNAVISLLNKRSELGLFGKHVNIRNGKWSEPISGIGSNADSFYEYLLKMYLLFGDEEWWWTFLETYEAVNTHLKQGDWFQDVDTFNGQNRRSRFENLMAFWPGALALMGEIDEAARSLNAFFLIWHDWGFLPEEFDYTAWQLSGTNMYPLRPELIESIYLIHQATSDDSWLWAGQDIMTSLQKYTKTTCGYATVKNMATLELSEEMPSYFLAETLKYLYLLFDQKNFIHNKPYIFSTEAHPFLSTSDSYISKYASSSSSTNNNDKEEEEVEKKKKDLVEVEVGGYGSTNAEEGEVIDPEEDDANDDDGDDVVVPPLIMTSMETEEVRAKIISDLSNPSQKMWYEKVYGLKKRLIDSENERNKVEEADDWDDDISNHNKGEDGRGGRGEDHEEKGGENAVRRMEGLSDELQSLQTMLPHWLSHFSYDPNFGDSLNNGNIKSDELKRRRDINHNQKLFKHNYHLNRNDPSLNKKNKINHHHLEEEEEEDGRIFLSYDRYLYNSYYHHRLPISTWADEPLNKDNHNINDDGDGGGGTKIKTQKKRISSATRIKSKKSENERGDGTTIYMEDLGTFQVSVFIDGFLIKHVESEEMIEISNLGSGVVSVVDTITLSFQNNKKRKKISKSVTANLFGMEVTCHLKLFNKVNIHQTSHKNNNKIKEEEEKEEEELEFITQLNALQNTMLIYPFKDQEIFNQNIPCAVAGFGIANNDQPARPIKSLLFFPKTDPMGCNYDQEVFINDDEEVDEDDDDDETFQKSTDNDEDEVGSMTSMIHSWLAPSKKHFKNRQKMKTLPEEEFDFDFDRSEEEKIKENKEKKIMKKKYKSSYGKIFVLERGQCMFEHKARLAETFGAKAVIIVNGEDQKRFIMAASSPSNNGKSPNNDKDDHDEQKEDMKPPVRIPVVMVSKEHGDLLALIQERLSNVQTEKNNFHQQETSSSSSLSSTISKGVCHKTICGCGPNFYESWCDPISSIVTTSSNCNSESVCVDSDCSGIWCSLEEDDSNSESLLVTEPITSSKKLSRGHLEVVVEVEKLTREELKEQKKSVEGLSSSWPSVHVSEKAIQVLGKGKWGAYLTAKTGNDWQLFIVKKQ